MASRLRDAWWIGPVAALAASGLVGWYAFVARQPVPILDWFDLAVHEVSHLVAAPLPSLAMFLAGSVGQVAFPLAMAWYFGIHRRERAAGAFCLAWAGTSAWDVSVYVADAPVQALPLVGGGQHDWAYILGPRGFDAIEHAATVARVVDVTGALLVVVGMVIAGSLLLDRRSGAPVPSETERSDDDAWAAAARLPFRYEPVEERHIVG